ncbi:MAG TPA: hypothetical protein VNA24_33570 [Hyalangium sp.]|nr:hypothetical protein [Hyalangium sp.]
MPAGFTLSYQPTANVDVGMTTEWIIEDTVNIVEWSSPGEGTIVRLEVQDGRGTRCKITGLAAGQTTIIMKENGGAQRQDERSIGVGLMFVYAPDGSLWAASTASFRPVGPAQASKLPIPTLEQMEGEEAYYVPPGFGTADANVTCYVINLGYISETEVWTGDVSTQTTAKKSGK